MGILGWDILSDGQSEVINAAMIALFVSLVLWALRAWKLRSAQDKQK